MTFDELYSSPQIVWSLLYYTGYLTKASDAQCAKNGCIRNSEKTPLVIPNKEIKELYVKFVQEWFYESMQSADRNIFIDAFWSGDAGVVTRELNRILIGTISYFDYAENFYHAFLAGIFSGLYAFRVTSNRESGVGRSDIVVEDPEALRLGIIEVKSVHTYSQCSDLLGVATSALEQILAHQYATPYMDRSLRGYAYKSVIVWGLAFWKKSCTALCRTLRIEEK